MIELYGIFQSSETCLVENRGNPNFHTTKWKKKRKRKLDGWTGARIWEDFQLFTQQDWEHFYGVQEVHSHPSMIDYPFYDLIDGRSIPRPARQILEDFRKIEAKLLDNSRLGRFCTDGELVHSFPDGWGWYKIIEGRSKQEAIAMHHCGNEGGKRADVMYSLRQSVAHPAGNRLKPHLTLIVNNGLIGEAKAFANEKPDSLFHGYIEEFLKMEENSWNRGWLHCRRIIFNSSIFQNQPEWVCSRKPDFRFDPIGEGGILILSVSHNKEWRHFGVREQVMISVNEYDHSEPQWLALQENLEIMDRVRSNSLAGVLPGWKKLGVYA